MKKRNRLNLSCENKAKQLTIVPVPVYHEFTYCETPLIQLFVHKEVNKELKPKHEKGLFRVTECTSGKAVSRDTHNTVEEAVIGARLILDKYSSDYLLSVINKWPIINI
jgi:hypothetical protein